MTEKKDLNPENLHTDALEEFEAEQLDEEALEDASGGSGFGFGCDCSCKPA